MHASISYFCLLHTLAKKSLPLLATLVHVPHFFLGLLVTGVHRQQNTRGNCGHFWSDGIRCGCGGGPDTEERGWHIGQAEWYHAVKIPYQKNGGQLPPVDDPQRNVRLQQVADFQKAWRACHAAFLSLLYSYLSGTVGLVLLMMQTAIMQEAGMQDVRLQPDVPYHQSQSSMNADVGCHKDTNDEQGTTITWLKLKAPTATQTADVVPSATFIVYDLGCCFVIGHLTHLWVRSDRYFHGTIRDFVGDTGAGFLFGTALANTKDVTTMALKVLRAGGPITWTKQY